MKAEPILEDSQEFVWSAGLPADQRPEVLPALFSTTGAWLSLGGGCSASLGSSSRSWFQAPALRGKIL